MLVFDTIMYLTEVKTDSRDIHSFIISVSSLNCSQLSLTLVLWIRIYEFEQTAHSICYIDVRAKSAKVNRFSYAVDTGFPEAYRTLL